LQPAQSIYTIGHSRHAIEDFLALLMRHRIDILVDVRSTPFSRFNPQFNRQTLDRSVQAAGMEYVFLGDRLGARADDESCYEDDRVQYDRLARTAAFQEGLERVLTLARDRRVAIMCAEKEPLQCHRTILVARRLVDAGRDVQHIHADGHLESHDAALDRLMALQKIDRDLFRSRQDLIEDAYRRQAARIGYVRSRS
jgi:uncharacterized protein (DUF488 family)